MAMVTLAGFIVVAQDAFPMRYKRKAVLVCMCRSGESARDLPNDNLGKQFFTVRDAAADQECGFQAGKYGPRGM